MNAKHRLTVIFAMLSLTVLMLFFQNCSPQGNGLFEGDSGGFITNPPVVYTSKSSNCATPSQNFKVGENIYMCVQNAGAAPQYCFLQVSGCTAYATASAATGWVGTTGSWIKLFKAVSVADGSGFVTGSHTVYVMHTEDISAVGQYSFTVAP